MCRLSAYQVRNEEECWAVVPITGATEAMGEPFSGFHHGPTPLSWQLRHSYGCGSIFERHTSRDVTGSSYSSHTVASMFMEIVGKIHGLPRSLVSDRDPLFLSNFWHELFQFSGTQLPMSSAYHPQSDAQTEVMNRIIEQYLRAFVHRRPKTWGKLLL